MQCAGQLVAQGKTKARLGQSFPSPSSQLFVDQTCRTWVYDPIEGVWVLTEQPSDPECLARQAAAGTSWLDQELIPGLRNLYLAVGGGVVATLLLATSGRRR